MSIKLTETEVRTRFITPAIQNAGWQTEDIREELYFTDGRVIPGAKGEFKRAKGLKADYVLFYNEKLLAVVEAKDNTHSIGDGMQQAINYSNRLNAPFAYSSNGEGFIFKDMRTGEEKEIGMEDMHSPQTLWESYIKEKELTEEQQKIISEPYFQQLNMEPRYYQRVAIEKTVEAVAKGQGRIMLVMATGTGKTYTAFQIIHRLWKSRAKKRILFLADRNILVDQTMVGDFEPFKGAMTKVSSKKSISEALAYEIHLGLYQQLKGHDGKPNLYEEYPRDYFDLVVIDECHRGSVKEDSAWREIIEYFSSATHLGMTATPKHEDNASNFEYFGNPVYTYSLKQGIEDGFLAPYRVIRVGLDKDIDGLTFKHDQIDKYGNVLEKGFYGPKDINRSIILEQRDKVVAKIISDYLKDHNKRYDKTIIFCSTIDHAERMRQALINENLDMYQKDYRYVMRITGDNDEGKKQLDNFMSPRKKYPSIVTTSDLLSTGVNVKTCKLIVLDKNIGSMTEFKQIIGRGTRIAEDWNKGYFTIIDFKGATQKFEDPEFDGEAVEVEEVELKASKEVIENPENEIKIPVDTTEIQDDFKEKEKKIKYHFPNIRVEELYKQIKVLDSYGNLITDNFQKFIKNTLTEEYENVTMFVDVWNKEKIKNKLIHMLEEKGIYTPLLKEFEGEEYDVFDLILKVAYGRPPLTRTQRALKVKQTEFYNKYEGEARQIIDLLIVQYIENGIEDIEEANVLETNEIKEYGTKLDIINNIFGGIENYMNMLLNLKQVIYS